MQNGCVIAPDKTKNAADETYVHSAIAVYSYDYKPLFQICQGFFSDFTP